MLTITNEDNMALMSRYSDKHFDLAIVDPEYGIGMDGGKSIGLRKKWPTSYKSIKHVKKEWDNKRPSVEYFNEMQRVSKNYIIWGANYFSDLLPPCKHVISWDKCCEGTSFSHFEIAFTSFEGANRIIKIPIQAESQRRIHPTQKPVVLYKWLLDKYGNGGKILDTHLGSGSIAIACHDYGYDLTACEIDKDLFKAAMDRVNDHKAQLLMF